MRIPLLQVVEFGSELQNLSIELRRQVLRIPLGLDFSKSELEMESEQIHCAALLNDKPVGILLLKEDQLMPGKTMRMRQVAILPELQSRGIGSLLVGFSEQVAKERKYERMELNARETALLFYEKLGYTREGECFPEVGIPHFRMFKLL